MAALFIACGILSIIADMKQRRAGPMFDKTLAALFGAVLAFGAISQLWTINPGDTLGKAGQLAMIFAPLVCLLPIIGRMQKAELAQLGKLVAIGFFTGLAVYMFEMITGFILYDAVRGGYSPDVVDIRQNKAVVLLALWAYAAFPFFASGKPPFPRRFFWAGVVVLFYITCNSESMSAQLVLYGTPFYAAILYFARAGRLRVWVLGAMAVLVLAMPFVATSVARSFDWKSSDLPRSVKSRIEIWDQASRRAFEKPVFGWGLDASPKLPNRDDISYDPRKPIPLKIAHLHPHNAPIQVWFELGLAGIAALIALFAVFNQRIRAINGELAQKYALFMTPVVFLYTLSIWGIWQSWFVATLCFTGLMAYAGVKRLGHRG